MNISLTIASSIIPILAYANAALPITPSKASSQHQGITQPAKPGLNYPLSKQVATTPKIDGKHDHKVIKHIQDWTILELEDGRLVLRSKPVESKNFIAWIDEHGNLWSKAKTPEYQKTHSRLCGQAKVRPHLITTSIRYDDELHTGYNMSALTHCSSDFTYRTEPTNSRHKAMFKLLNQKPGTTLKMNNYNFNQLHGHSEAMEQITALRNSAYEQQKTKEHVITLNQ